jgi:hypothetical protein
MVTIRTKTNLLEVLQKTDVEGSTRVDLITPNDLETLLKELGTKFKDDWETNGWQVDFWLEFNFQNTTYSFSGSWYHGGYTIELAED